MGDFVVGRAELVRALDEALDDSAVVFCGLGSASRAWRELESPRPTYYASDPMGMALPLAAGFAMSRPDRLVALVIGDGDLLMGLGSLVTVAGAAPSNLRVFLAANGRYETGGGQPVPGDAVDLVSMVTAAGWPRAAWSGEDLDRSVVESIGSDQLALLGVAVASEPAPYGGPGRWSGIEERMLFELRLADGAGTERGRED